ncbi:hypothetical protein [Chitinophaga sancti]|uniref:Uncharacterized protein n=1 Tax=Chitinophaga sancti TaxID=1004 RepID=A0A1K1SD90_9BACT|nr:hypothetical protein [Chitinophaga sancti]WQD59913.1 hypothetical protein U0033_18655 [Chitinophaga sancti]WQG87957.1 hypothetical protein SR876_23810 [Chitinophaga sancti]SFW82286.1 hypothetical protein SAMN05661012_05194 [Chitinophaga sancti]
MIKLTREEFEIPSSAMLEVCSLICEHELSHQILSVDDDMDIINIQLHYSKQEREVIHQIEDLIADHGEDDEEDDE